MFGFESLDGVFGVGGVVVDGSCGWCRDGAGLALCGNGVWLREAGGVRIVWRRDLRGGKEVVRWYCSGIRQF